MTTDKVVEIDREYPKVKHESDAADAKCVTVRNAEEEAALGEGWLDGHEYWTAQRIRMEKPAEEPTVEGLDLAEKEDVTPDVTADPAPDVTADPAADVTADPAAEVVSEVSEVSEPAAEPEPDPAPRKKGKGKLLGMLGFALLALSFALGVPHASAQQGLLARSQALNSTPAASAQATVSFPAAPEKWVFDQVCFSGGATTAPALTQLSLNIRDGASGAGTVLASFIVVVPNSTGQNVLPFCTPLSVTGSFNTAATAEWSAALTNEFEQVTLYVHKAQ